MQQRLSSTKVFLLRVYLCTSGSVSKHEKKRTGCVLLGLPFWEAVPDLLRQFLGLPGSVSVSQRPQLDTLCTWPVCIILSKAPWHTRSYYEEFDAAGRFSASGAESKGHSLGA